MDSLNWRQDSDGLHVMVETGAGVSARFTIRNSHINFLLAGTPRMYHVFIKLNGSDSETQYILDLESLRPVINKANGLRISLGRKQQGASNAAAQQVGYYSLARGESYQDRFLAENGWQDQRVYLPVYASSAPSNNNSVQAAAVSDKQTAPPPAPVPNVQPAAQPAAANDFSDVDLDVSDEAMEKDKQQKKQYLL